MPNKDIKPTKQLEEKQLNACNELLTQQVTTAWEEISGLKIPATYKNVANIVFVGMGGSSLGGHLFQSVYRGQLKVPFELVRDYTLPNYVNSKSLVILSSFSGSTEEVLAAALEAKKRHAKILGIASGGKLVSLMKKEKWPGYIFDPGDLAP
ncbi:SIS domain-containing protein, partial [Patescibacteria group bacterium]|nr:SIS domain-containing protein [Patescibacteria group bacterium]